jgi:hypothetical protein
MYSSHARRRIKKNNNKNFVSIVIILTHTLIDDRLPSFPPPRFSSALGGLVPVVHHHSPFHSMTNVLDRQSTLSVALLLLYAVCVLPCPICCLFADGCFACCVYYCWIGRKGSKQSRDKRNNNNKKKEQHRRNWPRRRNRVESSRTDVAPAAP